jgi:hypothetical protein
MLKDGDAAELEQIFRTARELRASWTLKEK